MHIGVFSTETELLSLRVAADLVSSAAIFTHTYTHLYSQRQTVIETKRDRQTNLKTDGQTDKHRLTHTHTHTDTQLPWGSSCMTHTAIKN